MDDKTIIQRQFILGHMPFVGVSYQSKDKDEEYQRQFSDASTIQRLIEAAIDLGIYRFASTTPFASLLAQNHLTALRNMIERGHYLELISCIEVPLKMRGLEINPYKRWATYAKLEEEQHPKIIERMLNDPILNFREEWQSKLLSAKPYKHEDFQKLSVDWPIIDQNLRYFSDLPNCLIELGSETDFLAMIHRTDLLGELIDRVRDQGFEQIVLGSHHAGVTIPIVQEELEGVQGFVTPLNSLGIMMFPTKKTAEIAIENTKETVYVIKSLAGGRIPPYEAFTYLLDFKVEGIMVGASSITELKEDFEVLTKVLMSNSCTHAT